jgi:O-antigen biosynthesis protein WbqP
MSLDAETDANIHASPLGETIKTDAMTIVHGLDAGLGAPTVGAPARSSLSYAGKRSLDLSLSILLLTFFLPLLLATWIAVRLDSRGPGLFWSYRVGRQGVLFPMPKFRTMTLDAPLAPREDLGPLAEQHMRPLGRMLRKSSIDEIPQLWCIARGDMSFIGPRPLLPDDEAITERKFFPISEEVLPGVSGVAQIRGRNYVTPRRKARYDSFYAKNCSLVLDVYVLLKTFIVVFTKKGVM